ncbi:hypothetical protein K458DRAFT_426296 [Lentithecium fluviatile CBS 122367]|uniref:Uncharacterized protein n=1 Tax=Lentithecium fluviatile CBS 122367 TaxID=1168545 RepID=A0A6G1JK64_9PLEO|nr:hypothetical protein K458DRAFT_426296 [Lentithecium fluviatile CBS 122367]
MSNASNSTDTALLISFGVFTLIVTIAGIHYRDSLYINAMRDIEAAPEEDSIELQPRLSLPLYYDGPAETPSSEGQRIGV